MPADSKSPPVLWALSFSRAIEGLDPHAALAKINSLGRRRVALGYAADLLADAMSLNPRIKAEADAGRHEMAGEMARFARELTNMAWNLFQASRLNCATSCKNPAPGPVG